MIRHEPGVCDGIAAFLRDVEVPMQHRSIDPVIDWARLSPDGRMLSYLAPFEGKLSVWIKTIGQADDCMVAHDPVRPIPMARWQGDGAHILYLQDSGGNENFHLFQVDLLGNTPVDLTPGSNVRAHLVATEFQASDDALLAMNKRLPSLMDVYRVHFPTATVTLDTGNPGDVLLWWSARLDLYQWRRDTLDKESVWDGERSTSLSRW